MVIKSLAQTLKDLATGIKNTITGITSSNATLTIIKGNGTTSTVTVNNVANAGAATKATQDSAGQQINSTYIKGLSVSGQTITYTKGDNTTGTITTQDTAYTHPNSGVTAGTYKSVTVNAQGHVTDGSNPTTLAGYGITDASLKGHTHSQYLTASSDLNVNKLKGVISLDNLPAGALERLVKVTNDTARFALTTNDIQLGDTVKVESTKMMYIVKDITKLNSEDGYEQYTAGMASSVPWSGVTGKPSSYTPSAHTHDDRYYTESEINTKLAGKSDTSHTHDDRYYTESEINSKVNTINSSIGTKADKTHTHDDRYYTESEVDSKLSTKSPLIGSTSLSKLSDDVTFGGGGAFSITQNNGSWWQRLRTVDESDKTLKRLIYEESQGNSGSSYTELFSVDGNGNIYAGGTLLSKNGHTHDDRYYTESEMNTKLAGKSDTTHTHDNRYYTESEIDSKVNTINTSINNKSDKTHTHDDRYYTESEINTKLSGKSDTSHTHNYLPLAGGTTTGKVNMKSANLDNLPQIFRTDGVNFAGIRFQNTNGYLGAIGITGNVNNVVQRLGSDGNLYPILDSSNYNSYAPTKTGGGASGTWGINISGNSATATKAIQDSAGQQINATYIKGLSVSGKTITYTKGNGSTGTITTQDTVYTHPTTAGNKHIPSGGSSGQILRWSADGTAVWGADNNTTYSAFKGATSSVAGGAGLVPAPSAGAQAKYLRADGTWQTPPDTNTTYSAATSSNLGLVKIGSNISVDSGTISLTKANVTNALGYTPPTTDTNTWRGIQNNLTSDSITESLSAAQGKALKALVDSKAASNHTHNYAGSSSAGGSANSAVKLATARTIGIGTGATGTATSFDGSGNITIPITDVKESYLSWGGKNFSGAYGCIDAAMIPDLGANRLAFGNASGIKVEYSTNGGSSWTDYGLNNSQKTGLFGTGTSVNIGKATTSTISTSCKLRITIDSDSFGVYTALNKFAIYVSTNGSNGSYCTIEASKESTPTSFETIANNIPLSGWSGWNIINIKEITTFGNSSSKSSQYGLIRFTFGCTGVNKNYSGLFVMRIMGFGGVGWAAPSNMARYGTIYSYDNSQNVVFPASVTATSFSGSLSGNASTATKATQDSAGQQINTTYIKGLSVSGKTITYTKGNGTTGTITTQDTVYSLPVASSSTLGGIKMSYGTHDLSAGSSSLATGALYFVYE